MNAFKMGLVFALLLSTVALGEVVTKDVTYSQNGETVKNVLYYDDAFQGQRAGVLVFPQWWGLDKYPKGRAEQLAKLGYVALAVDVYGEGKTTSDPTEAGKLAGRFKSDIALFRSRATAALDALSADPHVDKSRLAAIGYCFGGTASLELARSGAPLAAIVAFHADLSTKTPADASNIKAKVLVCTGADDSWVPMTQVSAFADEMRNGHVDYQIILYGGAHHSFTDPSADSYKIPNVAYNRDADVRSFQAMKDLFKLALDPEKKD